MSKEKDMSKEEKLNICKECSHYIELISTCSKCGCFIPLKLKVPGQYCPIGKWKNE